MENIIKIFCENCSYTLGVKRESLDKLWNKKVKVACPKCRQMISVLVNAELMSGANPRNSTNKIFSPDKFHTQINEVSREQLNLLKIQIMEDPINSLIIFPLQMGENIVGRQSPDDISLPNKIRIPTSEKTISRNHCQIIVEKMNNGSYRHILEDLGSLNKTHHFIDGSSRPLEPEEKIILKTGSIIGLGYKTKLKFI